MIGKVVSKEVTLNMKSDDKRKLAMLRSRDSEGKPKRLERAWYAGGAEASTGQGNGHG